MLHGGSFFSLVPDFSKRLLYYTILLLTRVPLTKWPEERLAIMVILNTFLIATNQSPFFDLQGNYMASNKCVFLSLKGFSFQDQANPGGATSTRGKARLHLGSFLILISQSVL